MQITPHMTKAACDDAILATHLGQAHIAGTGPRGATCRECIYFCSVKKGKWADVGHYSSKHATRPNELKDAHCAYPIANKAHRKFPPTAQACRFFSRNENAPALTREAVE